MQRMTRVDTPTSVAFGSAASMSFAIGLSVAAYGVVADLPPQAKGALALVPIVLFFALFSLLYSFFTIKFLAREEELGVRERKLLTKATGSEASLDLPDDSQNPDRDLGEPQMEDRPMIQTDSQRKILFPATWNVSVDNITAAFKRAMENDGRCSRRTMFGPGLFPETMYSQVITEFRIRRYLRPGANNTYYLTRPGWTIASAITGNPIPEYIQHQW